MPAGSGLPAQARDGCSSCDVLCRGLTRWVATAIFVCFDGGELSGHRAAAAAPSKIAPSGGAVERPWVPPHEVGCHGAPGSSKVALRARREGDLSAGN